MRRARTRTVRAAWAALALALPAAPGARPLGPEPLLAVRTGEGPRVLLAGVGVGTPAALAAERLGGARPGLLAGPILRAGEIDGVPCRLLALVADARVASLYLECEGGREEVGRVWDRLRAALSALPSVPDADGVAFGEERLVARLAWGPPAVGARGRQGGPRRLGLTVHR